MREDGVPGGAVIHLHLDVGLRLALGALLGQHVLEGHVADILAEDALGHLRLLGLLAGGCARGRVGRAEGLGAAAHPHGAVAVASTRTSPDSRSMRSDPNSDLGNAAASNAAIAAAGGGAGPCWFWYAWLYW